MPNGVPAGGGLGALRDVVVRIRAQAQAEVS